MTLAMLVSVSAAEAGPKRARLTIDVKVAGTESVVGSGSDRTSGRFREGYTLVTYLESSGELEQFNTKDPQYAQKMMGMAAGVHAQASAAQGKPGVRVGAKKMSQAEMQTYVQKKQAACGADTDCLMKLAREAQDLMANTAAGEVGTATAAYTGDEPERFLSYLGFSGCGAKVHVYVDRTIDGTFGDVNGAVPYSRKETVDYHNDATQTELMCNLHQAVLDTQDGTIWTDGAIAPNYKGTSTTTLRGKSQTSSATEFGHAEAFEWVSAQLRHAPRSGHRTAAVKLTRNQGAALHTGRYAGEATIDLVWRFEDVK
jgi:hypothetical protein